MGRVHQHGPDARHLLSDVLVHLRRAESTTAAHQSYCIRPCDADYDFLRRHEMLCLCLGRVHQHGPDACKEGEDKCCGSKEDDRFMEALDAEVHRVNRYRLTKPDRVQSAYSHLTCRGL